MKTHTSSAIKMALVVVMVILFAGISIAAAFIQFYKPQAQGANEPFPFDTDSPSANEPPNNAQGGSSGSGVGDEIEARAPKQEQGEYELIDGAYNFLVVGYDRVAELTDVMMIVNFNVNTGKLSILQIPRDTYVDSQYSNVCRMNAVFNQVPARYLTSDNPDLDRLTYMEKLFEQNLCLNIYRSVLIDLDGFDKIVDAVGGVDVDIPFDMDYDDEEQDLSIHLTAGRHHLSGEEAEGFIRFRDTYTNADIARLDAQKIFMSALLSQIKSLDFNVTALIREVIAHVTTGLTVPDCVYFAKEAMGIDLGDVRMMTLPTIVYGAGIVMNREAVLGIVNENFNVYNIAITDSIFDKNLVFTDSDNAKMHGYYSMPADELHAGIAYMSDYTADAVLEDSIHIQQKK